MLVRQSSLSEVGKYLIVDFRMSTNTIVNHLNILKDHFASLSSGFEFVVAQTRGFERAKESLHRSMMRTLVSYNCLSIYFNALLRR